MAAAWKEPQVEEAKAYMSGVVVDRAAANDDALSKALTAEVLRFRGEIGRWNTLSDNELEVPPEALKHVLVLSVCALLSGTPNFQFVMKGPEGAESGFSYQVRQAERWLQAVADGRSVTYPTNPATTYPELVRHGSDDSEVDTTAA